MIELFIALALVVAVVHWLEYRQKNSGGGAVERQ